MSDGSPEQVKAQTGQSRQIRVFISSTFRDMTAERDHLVKFIFPQLRKLCESRGVTWGEVDLRWGITDEQAAEGLVLPICLEEISRCRPYFIGLLGERYGWIPEGLSADLIEREPWLNEHLHGKTSVTELEILHGVLNDPKMAGHAFFYLRDPAYVNSISEKDRNNFTAENAKDAEKLSHLKENIRHSGFPVRENYPDPKALGELVLDDLTKVINDKWPEGSQPDPLDREAMDHEAYAQSRERVYIGRQEYFDRLDIHAAANDTNPLVVLGESGSGKSALLANWVARYRRAHPDALVLQHYIGATPYSADWAAMLRRLMGEFKRRLGLQQDIPDQPDALRSAFPNWLYMAAAKGRVVLVLDALNQLEDRDGAPDLVWLPPVLPENVRLIVSTLPGRPLDEIQKRNWPTLKVELLSADERRKLIAQYLAQHAKSLNAARVERIAAAPPSANPLYLRVLMDELRLVRTHEELEERIGDYLKAESPYALYEKVIARWEQDYEGDSDLVGDTLSLLWAARRGLTETELLQALGKGGEPLPRAKWSPLFLAMSDALISRGGLLTFAHDFLRTAVENAYLPTEQNQQQAHLRLADYFERQLTSPRRTDELPWQLAEAKEWQRLQGLLVDHDFLKEVWERNQFEVKTYWTQIETGSNLRMVDAYRTQIEHPENESSKDHLLALTIMFKDMGYPEAARKLNEDLIKYFESRGNSFALATCLVNQSNYFFGLGDLNTALAVHKQIEQSFQISHNYEALIISIGNLALISQAKGDLDRAIELHQSKEQLCRKLGKTDSLALTLGNLATVFYQQGRLDDATRLNKEKEQICRQSGNLDGLQATFGNQALIFRMRGDLESAMKLLKEKKRLCLQLGNKGSLANAIGNQALILEDRGDTAKALQLLKEQEQICRSLGKLDDLRGSLSCQASLLVKRGDLKNALIVRKEEEQICRKMNKMHDLHVCLGHQALISQNLGDLAQAMNRLEEKERICRELGEKNALGATLGCQANIFLERGNLQEALVLRKAEEQICRELDDQDSLQASLGSQADILYLLGELKVALALRKENERICREQGNSDGLQVSLGNQACILDALGQTEKALFLHKEKEQICRKIGNQSGLAIALTNQASMLHGMKRSREGLPLADEALRLAIAHNYSNVAKQVLPLLQELRQLIGGQNSTGVEYANTVSPPGEGPTVLREQTISEIRESATNALRRGLWEAAETCLEKLLQQGEPVETVAPDLITALLNAHETVSPPTVTRIETLLAQLASTGHTDLAAELRQKLAAKQPKKPKWKFW